MKAGRLLVVVFVARAQDISQTEVCVKHLAKQLVSFAPSLVGAERVTSWRP